MNSKKLICCFIFEVNLNIINLGYFYGKKKYDRTRKEAY